MTEIHWTPELRASVGRRAGELEVLAAQERTIAEALYAHADEHYRLADRAQAQALQYRDRIPAASLDEDWLGDRRDRESARGLEDHTTALAPSA